MLRSSMGRASGAILIPSSRWRKLIRHISDRKPEITKKNAQSEEKGIQTERTRIRYPQQCRVSIVGLGGVGKSLAHLLKMYPGGLTELRLCNRSDPEGIVEELSHIPTRVNVLGFKGVNRLAEGLLDADIVVMSAGVSRKGDETREQLFLSNALICADIINICAEKCPNAMIAVISNPLDSLVPVAAEVLRKRDVYDPKKLFGVCHIDQMRSARYYAQIIGAEPKKAYVPVVGGHSETTMVPLFSRAKPNVYITTDESNHLIQTIRSAGKRVVQAKQGSGGSTYSMASAAMYFVHKLCRAIHHEPHVIVSAYVESKVTDASFFSNELLLGPHGIEKNLGYGKITRYEQELIDEATVSLLQNIERGREFVAKNASTIFAKK